MSMWTAVSDIDYDVECGNGDRWERRDEAYEKLLEEHDARDPEYEAWLASHGLLDSVECEKDAGWEDYLREQWEKSNPASAVEDDDIPF